MQNTVLVLTNSVDGIHSDIVISKLENLGVNVFRCDVDRLAKGDLAIKFGVNQDAFGFELLDNNKKLSSTDIKSIWYRRPNRLNSPITDSVQRRYAEMEIGQLLEGLWAATCAVESVDLPATVNRSWSTGPNGTQDPDD